MERHKEVETEDANRLKKNGVTKLMYPQNMSNIETT